MNAKLKKPEIPKGGFLALDWGKRKVGYATCDELGLVVTPRSTFERKKNLSVWKLTASDIAELTEVLEEFESGGIILGAPHAKSGGETVGSMGAKDLAKELEEKFRLPVILVSETLTSWEARVLDNTTSEDAKAASLLIEDFLRGLK